VSIVDNILTEYRQATNQEHAAREAMTKHADRRADLIRMLKAAGWSYNQIAKAVSLSPQRVGQLAKRGQQ
jgi:DNA-directed RNA polymerase specialized sigma24 family protein